MDISYNEANDWKLIEALLVVTSFLMMVGIAVFLVVVDLGFGGYEETVCTLGTTAEQFLFVAALYCLFLRSRSTEKKCFVIMITLSVLILFSSSTSHSW